MRDASLFRERFKRWKNGEQVYKNGLPIDPPEYSVGSLVNGIYANNPREEHLGEPSHHYDFTQSEEWADAHGYYPDVRGHRDDRVKKPAHPSHPSRGTWNGDRFELTDFGIQNPNYTLFGLNDGGQDPQAVLTYKGSIVLPEITITPKGNHIRNPYDNINLHLPKYAKGKDDEPVEAISATGDDGVFNSSYLPGIDVVGRQLYPVVTRNFNGDIIGAKFTGERKNFGNTFYPDSQTIVSPQDFSKYRLSLARQNDANHTHAFAEAVRSGMTDLMLGAATGALGYATKPIGIGSKALNYGDKAANYIMNTKAYPYLKAGATSYFGAEGLSNYFGDEGYKKTDRALREGRYGDAALSFLGDAMNLSMTTPLVKPVGKVSNAVKNKIINTVDNHFFLKHPNSFTRGIGNEFGLQDLVESGLVRGNPVGTEISPNAFKKRYRMNRLHFRDIMDATGREGIAQRYYNRTLSEDDFNAIKKAAEPYIKQYNEEMANFKPLPSNSKENRFTNFLTEPEDPNPLFYDDYQEYLQTLADDRKTLSQVVSFDRSGQPLAYFYDDGRNPLTAGHDYAASKYGVRINNASDYNPEVFPPHLHYSMPKAVALADPNVEVFRRGPLGITLKMNKEKLLQKHIPQITAENAASITPEQWTAAQDAAIAAGDMAEAQRLRDLHFKINTPENVVTKEGMPIHNYHGTKTNFNEFDLKYFGQHDPGDRGYGFYFSQNRDVASDYGNVVNDYYLNATTPYTGKDWYSKYINRGSKKDIVKQINDKIDKEDARKIELLKEKYPNLDAKSVRNAVSKSSSAERENIIGSLGNIENTDAYLSPYENVVYKPNQIKSADAITFDDSGIRIPLGERDNFNINDVRYSWLAPFLGLGILGTLKLRNKQKKNTENKL